MKPQKEIFYTDELNDDFAGSDVKAKKITGRYNYAPKNIFNTTMSVYDSIMTYNNNGAPHENKGFWVYFDKDVSFAYITLAWHYTSQPRDFVVEVDDSPATEPVNASEATIFNIDLPVFKIRCIRGTNGRYYFLRPKASA